MLLSQTVRVTGPPPPGMVPISGGSIIVEEVPQPSKPPIKNPTQMKVTKPEKVAAPTTEIKKPTAPPAPTVGGASAVTAQIIAADSPISLEPPQSLTINKVEQFPDDPEPEVSLRHPPPAEPLSQRTNSQLNFEELRVVQRLAARDREVRAHEHAHVAAAAGLAGSPSFSYVTGPDAQRYAVSGEVKIDDSVENGDPEATIIKMEQVKKSALAPAKPSGQDKAVAASADASIRQAEADMRALEKDEEETRVLEETVLKIAKENGESISLASIQQATKAFAQAATAGLPPALSLEGVFA